VHIIHGVTEAPELGDNIRVTVIATGFQVEKGKKADAAPEARNKNLISTEEWERIRGRPKQPAVPSRGAYPEEEDLDIPAAIRNFNFMSNAALGGKANEG
jgi:cell division GTPase FtsZ